MWCRRTLSMIGSFAFVFAFLICSGQADTFSDFSTGLDGWSAVGSGTLSYSSTGGNPLGYAQYTDIGGTVGDGGLVAPSKFLGNWSALNGIGQLKWDHIIISTGGGPDIVNEGAIISGPGGQATFTGSLCQTTWTTFSAPINSANWTINSGSWNTILNNVTSLEIRIEGVHNSAGPLDVDGVDNVHLTPEPSALTLLCFGTIGLITYAWRKRK